MAHGRVAIAANQRAASWVISSRAVSDAPHALAGHGSGCCHDEPKWHTRFMGHLIYGSGAEYEIDDRTLSHLKIAILSKLRLQESFLLNWTIDASRGSGRVSLWLSPAVPLQFRFSESRPPELNRVWLEALARSSHSTRGMMLMTEDEAADYLAANKPPV